MRWRIWILRTAAMAILAAIVVVAGWWLFERSVAGPGYRWTRWTELSDPTVKRGDDRIPSPQFAQFLNGRKITLLAQRFYLDDESNPDRLVPIIRMPARNDVPPGVPIVLLHETSPDNSSDGWRVVRVWGTLQVTSGRSERAAPLAVPLELQVDALGEDPRYLPDVLAPTGWRDWIAWDFGCAATVVVINALACVLRSILRCRLIGRSAAILSMMAAAALIVAAMSVSRTGRLFIHHGEDLTEIVVMPRGVVVAWASDYYKALHTEYHWLTGGSYSTSISTWAGLGFGSSYTRYDWGNVHAHASVFVGTPWVIAAFVLFALVAWRLARIRHFPSGTCSRCGYDLRATPCRCPECGTVTI